MDEPLAEELLLILRHDKRIDDDVVDKVHASSARVTQLVDLDRRRAIGEDRRPPALRKSVEVDQNIDLIHVYQARGIAVRGVRNIDEAVECCGKARSNFPSPIATRRITNDIEFPPIVLFHEPYDQRRVRMRSEIRRHVTDSDRPAWPWHRVREHQRFWYGQGNSCSACAVELLGCAGS